jgi:hypothetical protein
MWKRLFKSKEYDGEVVERAIEEQRAFERAHPTSYAPDQRTLALMQRARHIAGHPLSSRIMLLLADAAKDWERAATAAEETP